MTMLSQHRNAGTVHRGPSGFWPTDEILATIAGQTGGIFLRDDFTSFYGLLTTTVGDYSSQSGGWVSYQDSGNTITQLATETGGVVRITTDTTDNDEAWLSTGSGIVKVDDALRTGRLFFEARFRTTTIATRNIVVGLGEEGMAVADSISDSGVMVDKDFLGFRSLEGDADGLDFAHNVASGGGYITTIDDVQTLVASTWYKAGFLIDLAAPTPYAGRCFIDGVENGTYLTRTAIDAATFPAGEELAILLGVKNGAGAATILDVDWVQLLWLP